MAALGQGQMLLHQHLMELFSMFVGFFSLKKGNCNTTRGLFQIIIKKYFYSRELGKATQILNS